MKLRITILKYHSWYLCQISLQIMLLSILIIIQQNWSNPKYTSMKEMVFHYKLMEKTFFIFKTTYLATVQPASSDFRKAPWDRHFWEWHLKCLSKSNSPSLPFKPHYISAYKFSKLISILMKGLREFDKRSRHFLLGDRLIKSHNLISWQCMDIARRKLLLVTIGT